MKRTVLGVVVPLAWLVVAVAPFLLAWQHLPEPIASHWTLFGRPNGAMPRISVLAIHGGAAFLAAIAAFVATRERDHARGTGASVGLATSIGTLFAGISIAVVITNYGVATWQDAHQTPIVILIAPAAACIAAALASRSARTLDAPPTALSSLPTIGLGPTERAAWLGRARNKLFSIGAIVSIASSITAYALSQVSTAIKFGLIGVVLVFVSELHLFIDERGLAITFGPLGWPRIRVKLAEIRSARRLDIAPMKHGGWGYRGSLTIFGRAAAIVRGGDGIELQLEGNRTLLVSTDDAGVAAGLLNDLVRRRDQRPMT
jgi:hypothetical protein